MCKQMVKLRTVRYKAVVQIEHPFEHLLHLGNVLSNPDTSAQLRLDVGRCRHMVGMGVGLQNPLQLEFQGFHPIDHPVRRGVSGAP